MSSKIDDDELVLDENAAEDIRAAERKRILAGLSQAVADAMPPEPEAYIQGFKDGASFVAERLLGMLVLPDGPPA